MYNSKYLEAKEAEAEAEGKDKKSRNVARERSKKEE